MTDTVNAGAPAGTPQAAPSTAPPKRRKLVFFTSCDPNDQPRALRNALHFALVGTRAGLATEVRLAGDAVKAALPGGLPQSPAGDEIRQKMEEYQAIKGYTTL